MHRIKHGVTAFLDWRGFLIGAVVIATLYFSGIADRFLPLTPRDALARIVGCTLDKDAVTCARPYVRQMLAAGSPADVMNAIAAHLPAQQCHYIGHVVGQQAYINSAKDIEVAIASCNDNCDSACTHGIIGEAFAEELGFASADEAAEKQNLDLDHLSPAEIKSVGKKLCTNAQTCHGVGHALFQAYGKFEPSIAACDSIASRPQNLYCYQGAFMEYADIVSSRNMRNVSNVTMPTPAELDTLCDLPTYDGRRACYRYFPRVVTTVLQGAGTSVSDAQARIRSICEQIADPLDRSSCALGYGVYESYDVLSNPQNAIAECSVFTDQGDQAACFMGQASVATQDRQQQIFKYCSLLPGSFSADCYQQVFFFLNRVGGSVAASRALCGADAACLRGADEYLKDPSVKVQAYYAE